MVSSFDIMQEIFVTKGSAFASRPDVFRVKYIMNGDMFAFRDYDTTCRKLRKLSHRYLKQFGDGMSKLEENLQHPVKSMISDFVAAKGNPINPKDTIRKTALQSITVLMLGNAVDPQEDLWKMLMTYEETWQDCMNPGRLDMMMLDQLPWLIHLPLKSSREVRAFVSLQKAMWQTIKESNRYLKQGSFAKSLLEHVSNDKGDDSVMTDERKDGITDRQAGLACLGLIVAGIMSTSTTMHFLVSLLGYRKDIQDRIRQEILSAMATTKESHISLRHKLMMPYLRATILENLRHFSAITCGLVRRATEDTHLKGYGNIPKGTCLMINNWALNHDKNFWGDPEIF